MYKDQFDEFCDPDHPRVIKYEDVVEAANKQKPFIVKTPLVPAHGQNEFGIKVHYKLESLQKTGSFKARGAFNFLSNLKTDQKKIGVVLASVGNEAFAFCYFANVLHIPITVIMPSYIPISKEQLCVNLGAKVIIEGDSLRESQRLAQQIANEQGLTYVNGRDNPLILQGYGTLALELLEQMPYVDAIIVPIGTGGLAAAVVSMVKKVNNTCLVYGVESENMPLFTQSLQKEIPADNVPLKLNLAGTACSVNSIGVNAFFNAKDKLDRVIDVNEDYVAQAMLHLVEREKYIVEGSGALALSPIMGKLVPELKTKNVICVVTGGNIDVALLNRSLSRGLSAECRLLKFVVGVYNRPGAKADLMTLIAKNGYNVLTHFIDNYWTERDVYTCSIQMVIETKGLDDSMKLKSILDKAYPGLIVYDEDKYNIKGLCSCYIKKGAIAKK